MSPTRVTGLPATRVQPRLCSSSLRVRFEALTVTGSVLPCHPWAQQGSAVTLWSDMGVALQGLGFSGGVFTQGGFSHLLCVLLLLRAAPARNSYSCGSADITSETRINVGHQPKLFTRTLGKEVSWRARHSQKEFPSARKFLQLLLLKEMHQSPHLHPRRLLASSFFLNISTSWS